MTEFCAGCGHPADTGEHAECARRRLATDPPRFCISCGRKLVVQVLPLGWRARCVRCGELAPDEPDAANPLTPVDSVRGGG